MKKINRYSALLSTLAIALIVSAGLNINPVTPAEAQKGTGAQKGGWEYTYLNGKGQWPTTGELNSLGKAGWEVVCSPQEGLFLLKRRR